MACDCGVTIVIDVKIVAIESSYYLVLGLASIFIIHSWDILRINLFILIPFNPSFGKGS